MIKFVIVMDTNQNNLLNRITIIPGLMGGRPTIRGLRFTIGDVLEQMASGMTVKEILDEHPILEKDDIAASLLFASLKMKNTVVIHAD
jgi:uncharacterized protein (DUF433 family)